MSVSSTEAVYRATLPVFVNAFNQLTYVRDTLDWFARHGFGRVVVVDQVSTYPPLLAYYDSDAFRAKARLIALAENVGPRRALEDWPEFGRSLPYIFTDPDLALPDAPADDMVTRMFALSRKHRAQKVGLALNLDRADAFADTVARYDGGPLIDIVAWEQRFWRERLEDGVYRANVDTTFRLYNPDVATHWRDRWRALQGKAWRPRAIRVALPGFVAEHRPWFRDDGQTDEERAFYRQTAQNWTNWVPDEANGADGSTQNRIAPAGA